MSHTAFIIWMSDTTFYVVSDIPIHRGMWHDICHVPLVDDIYMSHIRHRNVTYLHMSSTRLTNETSLCELALSRLLDKHCLDMHWRASRIHLMVTLQCSATQIPCSVTMGYELFSAHFRDTLQCVAVCCSVLQCVAVCCSVLQCVAEYCIVMEGTGVCCSAVCCSVF